MIRLLYLTLFLTTGTLCFGQNPVLRNATLPFDSTTTILVNVRANRFDQSNALTRVFYQKLGFGGYISDDMTAQVNKQIQEVNHFGGGMHPGISLTFMRDSADYGFITSYQYCQITSAQFSDDLFNLIFQGNSHFGSEPADLTDTKFKNQTYQHIDFGLMDKKTGSFLTIGIYDGIKYQNFSVDDATFLTHYNSINGISYSDEVSLEAENLEIDQSTHSYSPFKNGFGFGLSGAYNLATDIGLFSFEINDLGLMRWNVSQADTSGSFEFQGLDWSPDGENQTGVIFETLKDSIQIHTTKSAIWAPLPGKIQIRYISPAKEKYFTSAQLSYYYTLGYYPELTVSLNMKYGERNTIWASATGGGYNYFDIGVGTQIQIFDRSFVTLGTRNLSGLFLNNGHAESLFVQLILKI